MVTKTKVVDIINGDCSKKSFKMNINNSIMTLNLSLRAGCFVFFEKITKL